MKTDNRDSEKDLNANPESRLNTNRTPRKPERFPESPATKEELKRQEKKENDDNIELLAADVKGTVSERDTGSSPEDIAGVSDLDRGMRRSRRHRK